jgi:SAM-dependent methyltransferase
MPIRTWESEEYHPFWDSRPFAYLDRVERMLLRRLVGSGTWFVDLGGGYGRLLDVYGSSYTNVVLCDYSISMLEDADRHLGQHGIRNVHLVAADVHHLPFVDSGFDGAMMVRVIHHIEDPSPVIGEVHRILRTNASFILEYQNTRNLNSFIKARLGLIPRRRLEGLEPFLAGNLYWTFHPRFMQDVLAGKFAFERVLGGGLFWNRRMLTTLMPHADAVDAVLAPFLGRHRLTHQLFLRLRAEKAADTNRTSSPGRGDAITGMLRCIACQRSDLRRDADRLTCGHCRSSYPIRGRIYDFRRA